MLIAFTKVGTVAQLLFDGSTLEGWEITEFSGHGNVYIDDSCIVIEKGKTCSGIRYLRK